MQDLLLGAEFLRELGRHDEALAALRRAEPAGHGRTDANLRAVLSFLRELCLRGDARVRAIRRE